MHHRPNSLCFVWISSLLLTLALSICAVAEEQDDAALAEIRASYDAYKKAILDD